MMLAKYRCYRCPHCGEQVESIRGRGPGRSKTAYYEANGERRHIQEWAERIGVTYQSINHHLKTLTMQQIFDKLTDPAYRKPGPKANHPWKRGLK